MIRTARTPETYDLTYDLILAARVREMLAELAPAERRMFGGLAFLIGARA